MNQMSAVDNDLQKAIDDITKSTNSDPVFADPVAAPAPVEPLPPVEPAPVAMPEPAPAPKPVIPEPVAEEPIAPEPIIPEPVVPEPLPEPVVPPVVEEETIVATAEAPNDLGIHQIKEAALRDLAPLLGQMDIDPAQKFDLYKNMIEDLHDTTAISGAYSIVKDLPEDKRGEALLYIIETADKL